MFQTRPSYLIIVFFFSVMALMGQSRLKGRVTDRSGSGLAFASVYELGTTNGTLTNEEGYFELELKPGDHQLAFQYLGYGSLTRKISFPKDKEIQVSLLPENFQIAEVEIVAGEDPAMPIIRKAIELRDQNLKKTPAYRSELYIKALMKIVDAPESFLGQNLWASASINLATSILISTTKTSNFSESSSAHYPAARFNITIITCTKNLQMRRAKKCIRSK
ncbi:MAG: carboxypeptidase-like regulatory domain-containing protein [Saprospiraceae bacterium]|nr:carboxypeptidase-like regulatory domain-containing protein [Saprospiraceae bacterium]